MQHVLHQCTAAQLRSGSQVCSHETRTVRQGRNSRGIGIRGHIRNMAICQSIWLHRPRWAAGGRFASISADVVARCRGTGTFVERRLCRGVIPFAIVCRAIVCASTARGGRGGRWRGPAACDRCLRVGIHKRFVGVVGMADESCMFRGCER